MPRNSPLNRPNAIERQDLICLGVGAEALIVDAASRLELQRVVNRCVPSCVLLTERATFVPRYAHMKSDPSIETNHDITPSYTRPRRRKQHQPPPPPPPPADASAGGVPVSHPITQLME